jgi:hypothetical protein
MAASLVLRRLGRSVPRAAGRRAVIILAYGTRIVRIFVGRETLRQPGSITSALSTAAALGAVRNLSKAPATPAAPASLLAAATPPEKLV